MIFIKKITLKIKKLFTGIEFSTQGFLEPHCFKRALPPKERYEDRQMSILKIRTLEGVKTENTAALALVKLKISFTK